jgi:hypothetical protein
VIEEPLLGGNTHDAIVKVGDTVRRPTGPWTPGVHALLAHLEAKRYPGAPRVLGLDDIKREILTYVPGIVIWPGHFSLVGGDDTLESVARLIRDYHDAVADFGATPFIWSVRGADPTGVAEVLCHNDFAPWNLVMSEERMTFIDWDLAAPGRRSWDLAWALLGFVPLMPRSDFSDADIRSRIAIFCAAYGPEARPSELLSVAVERAETEARAIETKGAAGEEPYGRLLRDGHADIWNRAAAHVASHLEIWVRTHPAAANP